jgi:hypothetical protein
MASLARDGQPYWSEVFEAPGRCTDEIIYILLLINESIVLTETDIRGDIPGD